MEARFRSIYSPLHLPLRAPDKVLARASFPALDCPSLQEGGPNTGSSSPLLSSPGQRAIHQNDVMINKKYSVFGYRITYLGRGAVAAQAHILGGVRTLYLGSEERFVHLLVRHAEEILNSVWSF